MSRSPGSTSGVQHSHTRFESRAPSLSVRLALVAVLALSGAPVLPFLLGATLHADPQVGAQPDSTSDDPQLRTSHTQDPQIREWVERLADPSYRTRSEASRELLRLGDRALPALREGLGSEDPELRSRAQTLIDAIARREVGSSKTELDRPPGTGAASGTLRHLDEWFEQLDRDLRTPLRLQERLEERLPLDELDRRMEELRERMLEGFRHLPAVEREWRLEEWPFSGWPGRLLEEGLESGSSRVQIWQGGEKVFDSSRDVHYAEIPTLGVVLESIHPSLRSHLDLPEGQGMIVASVIADGPGAGGAAESRLEEHDIILTVGGEPLTDAVSLRRVLSESATPSSAPRQSVELGIIRRGESHTLSVPLSKQF